MRRGDHFSCWQIAWRLHSKNNACQSCAFHNLARVPSPVQIAAYPPFHQRPFKGRQRFQLKRRSPAPSLSGNPLALLFCQCWPFAHQQAILHQARNAELSLRAGIHVTKPSPLPLLFRDCVRHWTNSSLDHQSISRNLHSLFNATKRRISEVMPVADYRRPLTRPMFAFPH